MARYSNDGMIKVYYVPTIANKAAPTTSELNAGTDLSLFVTKDGLQTPNAQNNVDIAVLGETYDSQVPGSFGGPVQLTCVRDNASDTAWNLVAFGLAGYIAVRRGSASATAWATGNKVEVYPGTFHEPVMAQTAGNEVGRFTAMFPTSSQPNSKATVP